MNRFFSAFALLLTFGGFASAQLVRQQNTTLAFPDELPSLGTYMTENALGNLTFSAPICTAFPAGETNRLFVAERGSSGQGARIQVVTNLSTTPAKSLYFSLSSILNAGESARTDGENGLLSMVFHPNFATNGTFFLYYSVQGSDGLLYQRLHRVTVSNPAANVAGSVNGSHTPLLTIRDRDTNHNGGDLHFGPDGYLYLSLGDEGGSNDTRNNARFINQNPAVLRTGFWGQLLRLDVDNRPENLAPNPHTQNSTPFPSAVHAGTYKVPADNPFIGYTRWHFSVSNPAIPAIDPATVRTEIYATGLRNPFRFSFDPPTGRLFLGDVGQGAREEVNIITKGGDFGWSWREGTIAFANAPVPQPAPAPPAPGDPPGTGFSPVAPIFDYVRSGANIVGTSITGGMVMRGNRLQELYGAYIYGDFGSGQIVALRENNAGVWTAQAITGDSGIVDFGVDPRNGDLLFCSLGTGLVKRLERSPNTLAPPPATLAQTGAFSDLANLTPHPGIVAYDANVPFWSDYAIKRRWFAIKNLTDTIGFSAQGNWSFPARMVWIKHFDIETTRGNPATRRKLETRFLVKTATDFYGLSYRWRADQSDADLVAEEGFTETIPTSSPAQVWRYPSRSECRACHTVAGGIALSFNTGQLNREKLFNALTQNQIEALSSAGYFAAPVQNVHGLPKLTSPSDATQSLEARVRGYLAANCAQCHQPSGGAQGNWDGRASTPTDMANLINGTLVNSGGDPANRFAVPGDVNHSMVLKRVRGDGVPRMPPVATNERDLAAEQLLMDWIIEALPTRQSFAQWQTAHFNGPTDPVAAPAQDPDLDAQTNALEYLQGTPPKQAGLPLLAGVQTADGEVEVSFVHLANRSCVVETSTNLTSWTPWNVPGNAPQYPAVATPRTLTGPRDATAQYFRLRFAEP